LRDNRIVRLSTLILTLALLPLASAQQAPAGQEPASRLRFVARNRPRPCRCCALPMLSAAPGCYLTGKYGLREYAGELVAELERFRPPEGATEYGGLEAVSHIQTLLDALIQLHYTVDPSILAAVSPPVGTGGADSLARDRQQANLTALLSLSMTTSCVPWLAVNTSWLGFERRLGGELLSTPNSPQGCFGRHGEFWVRRGRWSSGVGWFRGHAPGYPLPHLPAET